ncbi:MAG: Fe-S oxidoreductase, partial [Saprospiraceae bacterium]
MIISQILFSLLLVFVFSKAYKSYSKIYRNINLGRPVKPFKNKDGLRNMVLIAFGQQKMFKRPIPAVLHLFIYVAFVITQFDLMEQIIDGLTGSHRVLSTW